MYGRHGHMDGKRVSRLIFPSSDDSKRPNDNDPKDARSATTGSPGPPKSGRWSASAQAQSTIDYFNAGHAMAKDARIHLPNGQPILNNGSSRVLEHGIDTWFAAGPATTPDTWSHMPPESPCGKPAHRLR